MNNNSGSVLFYVDDRKLLKSFIQLPFFLLLLVTVRLHADVVSDLYQAKVKVTDQSSRAQERAIQAAFEQVLIKVSGSKSLIEETVIKTEVERAGQFLRQYQFETENQALMFVADFDAEKVDTLLRRERFPIWGSYRPSTILWLVEEKPSLERQLYSEYLQNPLKEVVLDDAKRRGVSLIFPLADIAENTQSMIYDVWGQFTDNIVQASQRYDVEVVMSARIYPKQQLAVEFEVPDEPFVDEAKVVAGWIGEQDISELIEQEALAEKQRLDALKTAQQKAITAQSESADSKDKKEKGWQADWMLIIEGKILTGSFEAEEKALLSPMLVDTLADELAERYAVKTTLLQGEQIGESLISLVNLASISDYVKVKSYFESLQAVSSVQLVSLASQKAQFKVLLTGREVDLLNALKLDDRVKRVSDAFGRPTSELEFVWNP
ncbi:DUF2066 domain-containing protein [Alteromonas sp. a30]|uniref:DUF2066 domain-containing protein n=1 Tax=Alteromonas sp. a30 TaxID=2730917 RepID=UPI00227EEA2B|nr:DUF2066 domain-containing protein [Alteromonas sp. a30]MCY7294109.1 DUF2066 domain-containing protein [Alteromonas sp. a30]